ncbi:MAG: hypothetical protein IJ744_09895 [Lachnospiraceae bacterium]|nr:hypothetical protein [Lachnospiraceae bacterium]
MKHGRFIWLLAAWAVLLLALVLVSNALPAYVSSLLAFPFEQIADGLGGLSRAGRVGNAFATALWAGISVIPAVCAIYGWKDISKKRENMVLLLLSVILFVCLYGMINPFVFMRNDIDMGAFVPVWKSMLGVCIWSVVMLYFILVFLRKVREGEKTRLYSYLRLFAMLVCVLFVAGIVAGNGAAMIQTFREAQTSVDSVFAVIRFVLTSMPEMMSIWILLQVMDVVDIAGSEEQEGLGEAAGHLAKKICLTLEITMGSVVLLNLLQLLFAKALSDIKIQSVLPLESVLLMLVLLLACKLLAENKELRDDNELFI